MSVTADDYDPDASIWRTVGQLELKGYTKREIHDHLRKVADAMQPESGFYRDTDGAE